MSRSRFLVMAEDGAVEALVDTAGLPPRILVTGRGGFIPPLVFRDDEVEVSPGSDPETVPGVHPGAKEWLLDASMEVMVSSAWTGWYSSTAALACQRIWSDCGCSCELAHMDKPNVIFARKPVGPADALAGASEDGRCVRVWLPLLARMPWREAGLALWRGFAYSALMWALPARCGRRRDRQAPARAGRLLRQWGIDHSPLSRWLAAHRREAARLRERCGNLPESSEEGAY